MIQLIEALYYRCLRDARQELRPFQILVGPNASGKSTFLDVVRLLSDLLNQGLGPAISMRCPDAHSLVWMKRPEMRFEVAVELGIPTARRVRLADSAELVRYEVAIGLDAEGQLAILGENLWLVAGNRSGAAVPSASRSGFPAPREPRTHIVSPEGGEPPRGWRKVVTKKPESGNDHFFAETADWDNPFRLGPRKLALANLPEDEDRFPVATWVKQTLMEGVQPLVLDSEQMRLPSPPGSPVAFRPDGSNLPWAVVELGRDPERFQRWIDHLRTALPELRSVETVEREEDRHRYLRLVYRNGLVIPSWTVSDGTLRLLALTLVGYLDGGGRLYLIEEPENGIHPEAVETVFQALSSPCGNQILCATHSPVFLSLAAPEQVLCFAAEEHGGTDIVRGDAHPNLQDWKRDSDLGTLFASGILG